MSQISRKIQFEWMYVCICMYHHLVYVDTACMKKQTNIRREDRTKSGKFIDETEWNLYELTME